MIRVSVAEIREWADEYIGMCLACGELRDHTEPDAHGYECDACGAEQVVGAEELLYAEGVEVS